MKYKEDINMLRHIFSFKLVIFFALVAFLGAVLDPPDARALTKCPCPFTLMYKASIAQAKGVGLTNKVDICFENSNLLSVEGGDSMSGPCFTGMGIFDLTTTPVCEYLYDCSGAGEGYSWGADIFLSPLEVKACRYELKAIAKLSGVLPCQQP